MRFTMNNDRFRCFLTFVTTSKNAGLVESRPLSFFLPCLGRDPCYFFTLLRCKRSRAPLAAFLSTLSLSRCIQFEFSILNCGGIYDELGKLFRVTRFLWFVRYVFEIGGVEQRRKPLLKSKVTHYLRPIRPKRFICSGSRLVLQRSVQIEANQLTDPALGHGHTVEPVKFSHGHAVVGDHQKARARLFA